MQLAAGDSEGDWRRIRILSRVAVAGYLLLAVTVLQAILVIPTRSNGLLTLPELLGVVAIFLLQLAMGFLLRKTLCPACQDPFFQSPMNRLIVHPLTARCQHCGIARDAQLPVETEKPQSAKEVE